MDVRSNGERIRLHLAEAGSGVPVLLHGWPQHWWCWRRVIEHLRGHYRLLVPDLRGFGWSEAPGIGYSAAAFARDTVGLLDALDLDRAHLVGHDWGGFTGFLLGLQYPSRVDRLLLCNTPGPWARLNPQVAVGLRRAWYAALMATPILGEQVVARPGFVPWFLRLGGQAALFPRWTRPRVQTVTTWIPVVAWVVFCAVGLASADPLPRRRPPSGPWSSRRCCGCSCCTAGGRGPGPGCPRWTSRGRCWRPA